MCEPKRRYQEQDERGVQLGLHAYLKFYELTQGSARLKTFEDFATSPYYRAFVKFGRYCVAVKAINPARFVEWLLKNNKKIDHWARDTMYTEYLTEYLRIENVNDALARAMEHGIAWAEETGHPAEDCLRYGNANAMVYAVTTGRISAWILYNCDSGQKFLAELDATQIAMIWPYIDSEVWMKKFSDYVADQEYVREMLAKAGW
jgi:hypothetical protein